MRKKTLPQRIARHLSRDEWTPFHEIRDRFPDRRPSSIEGALIRLMAAGAVVLYTEGPDGVYRYRLSDKIG